jgi:XTP/dITP diphosphohydrolase
VDLVECLVVEIKILFASQNKGKQNEAKVLFKNLAVELLFPNNFPELKDFDPEETGTTFKENALLKARAYAEKVNIPCIADDSGVEVDGMDGLPGIHSNRWFDGTPEDRNQEVLRLLKEKDDVGKEKTRTARYITVVAYYDPITDNKITFKATQEGYIAKESSVGEGFAYDKIFVPKGQSETFSVLGDDFKNLDSQRARAYKKIHDYLKGELALNK